MIHIITVIKTGRRRPNTKESANDWQTFGISNRPICSACSTVTRNMSKYSLLNAVAVITVRQFNPLFSKL